MRNPDREKVFRFKRFEVANHLSAMKVGTDGVLLGAWALSRREGVGLLPPARILDVGCGTGLIALMMAQRFPGADIYGIEIDPAAAAEASANFRNSPWSERLTVTEGDFTSVFPGAYNNLFDLIVSNPPFFTNGEHSPEAARLVARHEKTLPLETLLDISSKILSPQGSLCLVLPADRENNLKFLSVASRLAVSRLTLVSTVPSKPPRRLLAELRHASVIEGGISTDHLSLHDSSGGFTKDYHSLVKDFYLNL